MEEVWRKIDMAPEYEVSSLGNVRSFKNGKVVVLKQAIAKGYKSVALRNAGRYIVRRTHRLVAIAFLPNPHNLPEVNHIKPDKGNNRVENLEWCTHEDNIRHSFALGLVPRPKGAKSGDKNPAARMMINMQTGIFYGCVKEAAEAHNINRLTLSSMLNGKCKNWSYLQYA